LQAAVENGMDVFVTGDGTLVHQQNLVGSRSAIVALSTNYWPIIQASAQEILSAIGRALPGSFQVVECGRFGRNRDQER
jgi:hypothetical protein